MIRATMLLAALWACASPSPAAARPAPRQVPPRQQPRGNPRRAVRVNHDLPVLEEIGRELSLHVVRVKVYSVLEIRMFDGTVRDSREIVEGYCGGLVVSPDPVVIISASSLLPPGAEQLLRGVPKPPNLSDRRYAFMLGDGSAVEAAVWRRDRALNLLLLRPADPAEVPEELTHPIFFEAGARPVAGESLGILALEKPTENNQTHTLALAYPAGKETYARPVVPLGSQATLGMPVFSTEGRIVGLINASPPDEGRAMPRTPEQKAAAMQDPARDPAEWLTGFQRPVLMFAGEFTSLFEILQSPADADRTRYGPLGLEIENQGGQPRVAAVDEGLPAACAGLVAGDVILAVGSVPVADVTAIAAAIEAALEADPGRLVLRVERAGDEVEVILELPE